MLQNNSKLKSKIDQLWNKFWSGGISNPLTAIEQITYLLFMKRLDDLDFKKMKESEADGGDYISKFEGYFEIPGSNEKVKKQVLRWSYFKSMPSAERLSHVQMKVFPFLKNLNGEESPFTYYMKNAVFIIPKPALLAEAMAIIEEIFDEIEKDTVTGGHTFQDIQGDVYEMLLSEIATSGKNGQFRTPRHIIKLVSELVKPQLGDKIADPACGTGGFLLGAYQYIAYQLNNNLKNIAPDEDGFSRNSVSSVLNKRENEIINNSLYGYDIDVTMVRLALMNLIMHGIDAPHIEYKDTLSKGFTETNQYDIIMANPPFTGRVDKSDMNKTLNLNTTKTELLFLENIYNLLKLKGTAGVIIPQGVLFGSSNANIEIRKLLIDKCELKAVISMPSGIFRPYAGVKTAILIFTKGEETKNVWFYDMESDGYSLDDKRAKLDGHGDLQDIVERYKNRNLPRNNDRKQKYFSVNKKEIEEMNYDLSISNYQELVYEQDTYKKPEVLFGEINTIEKEINQELAKLKELLR